MPIRSSSVVRTSDRSKACPIPEPRSYGPRSIRTATVETSSATQPVISSRCTRRTAAPAGQQISTNPAVPISSANAPYATVRPVP